MISLAPITFALALAAQTAPLAAPVVTAESLVPAHSFAVLRAKSLDRLAEIALPFQRIDDAQAQPLDVLGLLGGMFGVQAKWELIDHAQPFLFAVSSSKLNQPAAFTLIATSKDAAALAADAQWKHSGWTCTAHGALVTITTEPSETRLAQESPLFNGLASADVVVRLDVQEVMAQYGEQFTQGARAEFEGDLADNADDEQAALAMEMFDGALNWIDAIETLGITVNSSGERMRFALEMSGFPGSPLVDVARIDPKPLETLARCIDPSAPIAFLGVIDVSKWMSGMKSLMELTSSMSGEETAKEAREMFANMDDVYAAIGPYSAGGMRFGRDGIAMTYALRPNSFTKLVESYTKLLRVPELPILVEGPTMDSVAGHDVIRYRIKMDPDKAPGMVAVDSPSAAVRAATNEMMTKFFGTDAIPVAYTMHEGTMLMSMGRETEMGVAIARVTAAQPTALADEMLRLLGPHNPGMVWRCDTPGIVESFLEMGSVIEGRPAPNAEEIKAQFKGCAPVVMTLGLDQRTWRLAFEADAVRMMKAFKALEPEIDEEMSEEDEMGVEDTEPK